MAMTDSMRFIIIVAAEDEVDLAASVVVGDVVGLAANFVVAVVVGVKEDVVVLEEMGNFEVRGVDVVVVAPEEDEAKAHRLVTV